MGFLRNIAHFEIKYLQYFRFKDLVFDHQIYCYFSQHD